MKKVVPWMLSGVLLLASYNSSLASSLQVAPVLVEVALPSAATSLQLRNLGPKPVTAQVRIYRWSQENGADQLTETREVIASPPLAEVAAGAKQLVRIVRVSKQPLQGEESYRVLVDEVPEPSASGASGVTFAVRYSIPVFFAGGGVQRAPLAWSVEQRGDRLTVTASNPGTRRVRIASLQVRGVRGETIMFGKGLVGYVLGGSMARWSVKGKLADAIPGSVVTILTTTDHGPLQATGMLRMPR